MRDPQSPWDGVRGWLRGDRNADASGASSSRRDDAAGDPAPGLFATFQAAYDAVNTRPYLIAVPLLLDLAFWLGPRVRSPELFGWFAAWPAGSGTEGGRELANALVRDGERAEIVSGLAGAWNLFAVNTLTGSLGREAVADAFGRPVVQVGPPVVALVLLVGLAIVGFWLKTLFMAPLAQLVRREPFAPRPALRRSLPLAARILALYLAGFGVLLLALVPFALLVVAASLAGFNVITLIVSAALVPPAWVLFHGAFAVDALILDGVGPMRAARRSYRVVRANLWPTAGFVALTGFVSWAVPFALTRVAMAPVGAALVIVAHAYVAAGLATASLLFYRERHRRLAVGSQLSAASGNAGIPIP